MQVSLAKTAEGKPVTMCKLLKPWGQELLEAGPALESGAEADEEAVGLFDADKAPEELMMQLLLQAGTFPFIPSPQMTLAG